MSRHRVRIQFRKQDDLRFLGHRDLVRLFERALRRTGVELRMSEGFHPKAKLSFPLALAVGIASEQEFMEVEFDREVSADRVHSLLSTELPAGIPIECVQNLFDEDKKVQAEFVEYELTLPPERLSATAAAVAKFWEQETCMIHRANRHNAINVHDSLESLEVVEGKLRIRQKVTRTASAQPREIVALLGIADLESEGCQLKRTAVQIKESHT